jgi:hypothetical protein
MDNSGDWLPLAEAARRIGVSLDTLRRRMKRGEVRARKVPTRHGPAWQVRTDDLPAPHARDADAGATADLVRLVRDLLERNTRLAEEVGSLRAQLAAPGRDSRPRRPPRGRAAGAD